MSENRPQIRWDAIAESMIYGGWKTNTEESVAQFIGNSRPDNLNVIKIALLIDIAQSLRVLRCHIFKDIPNKLDRIARNTAKPRKKKAAKK